MNGPTKPNEQSMEEILASIRKIIAEDPSKTSSEGTAAAAPAVPSASPGSPARPAAPFGRLSEALKSTFATTSPVANPDALGPPAVSLDPPPRPAGFGAPTAAMTDDRSRAIASELEDILDEPFASAANASAGGRGFEPPAAEASVADATSQWAVWRTPSSGPGGSGAQPSGLEKTAPLPGLPERAPPTGAPRYSEPSPVSDKGSPFLGRQSGGGFYPPSGSFGAPPAAFEPVVEAKPPSSSERFDPKLPEPATPPGAGSFGSLVPRRDAPAGELASTPPSGHGGGSGAPRFEPALPSEARQSENGRQSESAAPAASQRTPGKPAPVVIAAMPSARTNDPGFGLRDGKSTANPVATPPAAASRPAVPAAASTAVKPEEPASPPASPGISVPLPPRTALFSRPFGSGVQPAATGPAAPAGAFDTPAVAPAPKPVAQPAPAAARSKVAAPLAPAQVAASASALDALAAGLAASNASAGPTGAQPDGGAVAGSVQPVRTLEDAVADMIKPMLQKWLTDNMPRIIEKALRVETAQQGNPKPPES